MGTARLLWALLLLAGAVAASGCGGGGGSGSDAPSISASNLQYSPKSVSASTQDTAIAGSLDFAAAVDLATIRVIHSRGGDVSIPVSGASGIRSGRLSLAVVFTPHPPGTVTFDVWLVGVDGSESNRLSGSIEIEGTRPVAHAGSAQSVVTGTLVTLDGSRSSDANGDPLTYAWTLSSRPAGSSATLAGATTVRPTFTADVAGSYVLALVVNDGQLDSAPATVVITADAANVAPVADAGDAQNAVTGTVVTLDGSRSSDANGDPLTYAWALVSRPAGSAASLSGATTVSPTFTADLAGAYVVQLIVNDGALDSVVSTVVVTASAPAPIGATVKALATLDTGGAGGVWSHTRYVLGTDGVLYIRRATGQRLPDGSRQVHETGAQDIHGDYTELAFDERWVVAMVSPHMLHIVSGLGGFARTEVPFVDSPAVDYAIRLNADSTADAYFVLENGTLWKFASNKFQREQIDFPYPLRGLAIERNRSRSFWERKRNGDPSDDAQAAALRLYGIALDSTVKVSHLDDPHSFVTLAVPGKVVKLSDHSQWGVFALTEDGDVYWLNADAATVPGDNGLPLYDQPQLQDDGTVGSFPTFQYPQNEVVKLPDLPVICDIGSSYAIQCGTGQVYEWTMSGWNIEVPLRTSGGTSFGMRTLPKLADRFDFAIRSVAAVNEWSETTGSGGMRSSGIVFFQQADGQSVGVDGDLLPLQTLINFFP
jgi:hypothetical protein